MSAQDNKPELNPFEAAERQRGILLRVVRIAFIAMGSLAVLSGCGGGGSGFGPAGTTFTSGLQEGNGAVTISERNGMLKTYDLMQRHFGWDSLPYPVDGNVGLRVVHT